MVKTVTEIMDDNFSLKSGKYGILYIKFCLLIKCSILFSAVQKDGLQGVYVEAFCEGLDQVSCHFLHPQVQSKQIVFRLKIFVTKCKQYQTCAQKTIKPWNCGEKFSEKMELMSPVSPVFHAVVTVGIVRYGDCLTTRWLTEWLLLSM